MKNIPRYWGYAKTTDGIFVWRSSATSEAEAFVEAQKAAERVNRYEKATSQKERPSPEDYPYGVTLREKLLREIHDPNGELQAFITRNTAGAEVINVRNVMFLDWDTPTVDTRCPVPFAKLFTWIRRLFGGKKTEESDELTPSVVPIDPHRRNIRTGAYQMQIRKPDAEWDSRTPEAWEELHPWAAVPELTPFMMWIAANPDWSVRIYKTSAGYRGIVTHDLFDPAHEATVDLMQQFQCDPQYVRLCKRQESFRARLTPKGWRCGLWGDQLPSHFQFYWPFSLYFMHYLKKIPRYLQTEKSDPKSILLKFEKYMAIMKEFPKDTSQIDFQKILSLYQEQYAKAVEIYETAAAPYATCRYLGTVGNGIIHPDVRPILELHDNMTLAFDESGKTLA